MPHYIVQFAQAKMPRSCWGQYRRVAVLRVEDGIDRVAMISERARGVLAVVATWERCNVGRTARGAFQRALAEAEALSASLNAQKES